MKHIVLLLALTASLQSSLFTLPGRCIAHRYFGDIQKPVECYCNCNKFKRDNNYRCMNCWHFVDTRPFTPTEFQEQDAF